jgi:hypothetical protein
MKDRQYKSIANCQANGRLADWKFKVYHGDIELSPWLTYDEAEKYISTNKSHYNIDLYTYAERIKT